MKSIVIGLSLLAALFSGSAFSRRATPQPAPTPIASSDVFNQISLFDFKEGVKSSLDLRPTPIVTDAEGKATVEYEKGNADIELKVKGLPPPRKLGPYTTYVLWTLTPDGRAMSQGVVAGIDGGKGKLETRYAAPQFALIVTAEPHFAVSVPSNVVVLYNVGDKVKGSESKVTALKERADYSRLRPLAVDKSHPADLVAAEYSVGAAELAGASRYASRLFSNAQQKLTVAESSVHSTKKSDRKRAPALAREAVLAGEDARREAITAKAADDAQIAQAAAAARAAEVAAVETASHERAAQREALVERLNRELPTRETDRGLVSEIGGVQFAPGTADLSMPARERLARFAGIVSAYPDLKLKIEGYTDDTGSEEANDLLSQRRALAVRDYLIAQHVPASSIDAEGLASAQPVADNGTPEGRARNRRVEIGISGGPLGIP